MSKAQYQRLGLSMGWMASQGTHVRSPSSNCTSAILPWVSRTLPAYMVLVSVHGARMRSSGATEHGSSGVLAGVAGGSNSTASCQASVLSSNDTRASFPYNSTIRAEANVPSARSACTSLPTVEGGVFRPHPPSANAAKNTWTRKRRLRRSRNRC